jgi:hypothetical protein
MKRALVVIVIMLCGCAGTRFICRNVCIDKWRECTSGGGSATGIECDEAQQACLDCCDQGQTGCGGNR